MILENNESIYTLRSLASSLVGRVTNFPVFNRIESLDFRRLINQRFLVLFTKYEFRTDPFTFCRHSALLVPIRPNRVVSFVIRLTLIPGRTYALTNMSPSSKVACPPLSKPNF